MLKACLQQTTRLGLAACVTALALTFGSATDVEATPIYSLRSANACNTCHIEPLGWDNPDLPARKCTMDCNGCHEIPTGGGLRTPTGQFYGKEVLPTWGVRPSSHADAEKYRPKGFPRKGRYRLFEGFDGWWAGNIPMEDIPDRLGDIDPDPAWRLGVDWRMAGYFPSEGEGAVFPMQGEVYAMGRPAELVTVYAQVGARGNRARFNYLEVSPGDEEYGYDEPIEFLSVKEAWVKLGRFDYNSYVRAGRFNPSYGWRIPDHTSFIRRDLGFDQNRQIFGVEAGINPNYPYANATVFWEGLEGWPGDQCFTVEDDAPDCAQKGYGAVLSGGYRALGWSVGGNLMFLDRVGEFERPGSDEAAEFPSELTAGVNWGAAYYPLVYLGEIDVKQILVQEDGVDDITQMFAYHELNYLVYRGVNLKLKYDWKDLDINFKDDHSHRLTFGLELHPYTFSHLEAQYRMNFAPDPMDDGALANDLNEVLVILHFWL